MKKFLSLILLAVFSLAVTAQAATEPAPATGPEGEELTVTEVTGKVTAIDHEKRLVTVEGPTGNLWTTKVDDEVPNLDKVKKGDNVNIVYTESMAWVLLKTKVIPEPAKLVTTTTIVGTYHKKPMKVETEKVKLYARLTDVDTINNTVTLEGPGGKSVTLKVKDPAKLKGVQKGEIVEVEYTEAVAVAVTKK